jgi:hypothetical protein
LRPVYSIIPSPLEGEGSGGGYIIITGASDTPLSTSPPQGGREQSVVHGEIMHLT